MKKFSFVIPTYNKGQILRNTLESINNQKGFERKDYEVIIIDDGSSNYEIESIKDMTRNFELKYIYLDRTPESCRSRTRNEGWKHADGDIVIFLDADTLVSENMLEETNRYFMQDMDIVLISGVLYTNEKVSFDDVKSGQIFKSYTFNKDRFDIMEHRHIIFSKNSYNAYSINMPYLLNYSVNIAVSKRSIEKVGGFDENFKGWGGEDNEFGYRLYKSGINTLINSKIHSVHQFHGNNNDYSTLKKKNDDRDKNIDYFSKKHPELKNIMNIFRNLDTKERENFYKIFELSPKCENIQKHLIKFVDSSMLEDIKFSINELSKKEENEIIIEDYLENTDLDIYIQLLRRTKGIVRYYPMSKKIDYEAAREYERTYGNIS